MIAITLASRCTHRDAVLSQEVNQTRVLLNVSDGQYYALNEVGGAVWDLCDGERSLAEIAAAIGSSYDAPAEVIEADVLELVWELLGAGLLATVA